MLFALALTVTVIPLTDPVMTQFPVLPVTESQPTRPVAGQPELTFDHAIAVPGIASAIESNTKLPASIRFRAA